MELVPRLQMRLRHDWSRCAACHSAGGIRCGHQVAAESLSKEARPTGLAAYGSSGGRGRGWRDAI